MTHRFLGVAVVGVGTGSRASRSYGPLESASVSNRAAPPGSRCSPEDARAEYDATLGHVTSSLETVLGWRSRWAPPTAGAAGPARIAEDANATGAMLTSRLLACALAMPDLDELEAPVFSRGVTT
jgi:hypothetical protein